MKNELIRCSITAVIFVGCIMTLALGVQTNDPLVCCIGGALAGIYNYVTQTKE